MSNQYKILKEENRIRAKCMSPESQVAYHEAARYFRQSNRHIYDTQLMYKELIGIALAADARGENLPRALGDNPKNFYESLVENSRPNTLWSILSLWLLPFTFAIYFVFNLGVAFFVPAFSPVPFTLLGLTSMILGIFVIFLLTLWEKRRNISNSKRAQLIYLVVFAATLCLQMLVGKVIPPITLFALPAWLGVIIYGVLWCASCHYRDRCYVTLAKERPWQG